MSLAPRGDVDDSESTARTASTRRGAGIDEAGAYAEKNCERQVTHQSLGPRLGRVRSSLTAVASKAVAHGHAHICPKIALRPVFDWRLPDGSGWDREPHVERATRATLRALAARGRLHHPGPRLTPRVGRPPCSGPGARAAAYSRPAAFPTTTPTSSRCPCAVAHVDRSQSSLPTPRLRTPRCSSRRQRSPSSGPRRYDLAAGVNERVIPAPRPDGPPTISPRSFHAADDRLPRTARSSSAHSLTCCAKRASSSNSHQKTARQSLAWSRCD